jgi:hypothetical protein
VATGVTVLTADEVKMVAEAAKAEILRVRMDLMQVTVAEAAMVAKAARAEIQE